MNDLSGDGGNAQKTLQIDLSNVEGTYSNFTLLAHSPAEFVLDFARIEPGLPKAKVFSRIIMTPQSAKLLLRALESKVAQFEQAYGTIPTPRAGGDPNGGIGFKFP
ncbi:MAG: DUF3467 domain-containing protein [Candidatus Eisenbacteria bacterium]|uniref:DUF3467 domain-containing protein n=1 Tax=Eiseniibacteriota bacterium TaxID=2212470 RepID=A0A956SDL5_UNCEI|nr:DUF3467 domain-containing protein [Candidatus Eisenbacteria bacterium]MCB9462684.1 DUF3467 domain-containing protein [Candidatus Eisenbacteria bacterium]